MLKRAKEAGLKVTASASINHLTLNELDIGPYRTFLKLSPPLRAEDDRTALVAALASGLIDVVMSDHNPQDVEGKRLPFAEASHGAVGLETMLTAGLRLVHSGELTIMTLIKAMSSAPAELLGLPGGTLRPGSAADVIVLDLDVPWVLDPDRTQVEMQEHAVRRGEAARPRRAHHRCRPYGLRIRLKLARRRASGVHAAITRTRR